jgi:hypothetical protein
MLLVGSFLPPMPETEALAPETLAPAPRPADRQEPPLATLKQRLFAEDWLIRPLSRLERINPVFLKEFRQLWRSRAVSWMLWLLGGLILLTLAWAASGESDGFLLLQWGILLLPPILAIIQLNRSIREIDEQEMLFITALTPREIRHGKILSALAICLAVGLPLQMFLLSLSLFFDGFNGTRGFKVLLLMPVSCIALVTVAVAVAWSPLPGFHKRYLAPVILVLLSSPLILTGLWNGLLELCPDDYRDMLLVRSGLPSAIWLFLWLFLWFAAARTSDHWLRRRAAWRNL